MKDIKTLSGLELLEHLCSVFGPTGCEEEVASEIRYAVSPVCDEVTGIYPGGVLAYIKGRGNGERKKIMLSAHMDEVGFMIRSVDADGYLKFVAVGGIDSRVLCGRRVTVGQGDNKINGIIGAKPLHLGSTDTVNIDNMYIDIGASNKEETEKYVRPGDFAVFDSDFVYFGQDLRMVKGKAIDDRLGCAVLCDVMREIFARSENDRPAFDVYFAFTTREEVGLSGAMVAGNIVRPDYAIVIESTAVADIDGVASNSRVANLGEGGVLSILDLGTIYDNEFFKFALKTGERRNIPCQVKKFVSGGNDAKLIHTSGTGVKTIAISAPTRYIHTASNVIRACDYGYIKDLVAAIIDDLDQI